MAGSNFGQLDQFVQISLSAHMAVVLDRFLDALRVPYDESRLYNPYDLVLSYNGARLHSSDTDVTAWPQSRLTWISSADESNNVGLARDTPERLRDGIELDA